MTPTTLVGFFLSLWVVCSLNTAVAHELIHSSKRLDQFLGDLLAASVGYIHLKEEHQVHHARTGHHVSGDVARRGESIEAFAFKRYVSSIRTAVEHERSAHLRRRSRRSGMTLIAKAAVPLCLGTWFYLEAGQQGLIIYGLEALGAAYTVQAITYLQHYGLSEKSTPELAALGYAWEDGCWMQACVTLNHAFHAGHHLDIRRPFYELALAPNGLRLPASYPVMFMLAHFAPRRFHVMMAGRLDAWLTSGIKSATGQRTPCLFDAPHSGDQSLRS